MKGSPLLRVCLTLLGLIALLIPLRGLTNHRVFPRVDAPQRTIAAKAKVHLVLTSTTAPFTFEVAHLGHTIWKAEAQTNTAATDVELEFPREGIELIVEASWPEEKPSALKLEVSQEGSVPITQTLWGSGKASEVLVFANPGDR